jgi:predicted RNase H-like HicB family nuclease
MKTYTALFEYETGKSGYGVVFPDLPGCISAGDDYADAFRMAHEALALYADGEDRLGEPPLPEPRSLEEIKATWEDWDEWARQYQFQVAQIRLYPPAESLNLRPAKAFAIAG